MKYIEAPTKYIEKYPESLFLAGGITDCPLWQNIVIENLRNTNLVVFNPRRKNFPINDPGASNEQIKWEFDCLHKATAILFWFACETLCPIVLYELGYWNGKGGKKLFIGIHPDYKRKKDVEIQTLLIQTEQKFHDNLFSLIEAVKEWACEK